MMTKEEFAEYAGRTAREKGISYKSGIGELSIQEWKFYDSKARYARKQSEYPTSARESLRLTGGGYFRLFPYWLIRKWAGEKSEYMISYIHPRDLDAGQPMISELPWSRKFKSYVGLKGAEGKLRRLLTDFPFTDLTTADRMVDWTGVPVVEL